MPQSEWKRERGGGGVREQPSICLKTVNCLRLFGEYSSGWETFSAANANRLERRRESISGLQGLKKRISSDFDSFVLFVFLFFGSNVINKTTQLMRSLSPLALTTLALSLSPTQLEIQIQGGHWENKSK